MCSVWALCDLLVVVQLLLLSKQVSEQASTPWLMPAFHGLVALTTHLLAYMNMKKVYKLVLLISRRLA